MLLRKSLLTSSVLRAVLPLAALSLALTACGEAAPTATTARAIDPSCAPDCPSTCWADVDLGAEKVNFWLFNTGNYNESQLDGALLTVHSKGAELTTNLVMPDPIPSTFEEIYELPAGFDDDELSAKVNLIPGTPVLTCGVGLI